MMRPVQRSAAALALAALAVGHSPGPALAGVDQRTDLQIEVVGLKPGSRREVLIRVSNVGRRWVDRTTATVEGVPRQAGDPITARVPDLDPRQDPQGPTPYQFEFTYRLLADCDGHVVKASLATATDWNGEQEANTANNVAQREACPKVQAPPPPPPPPPPRGGDLGVGIDPDTPIGGVLNRPPPVVVEKPPGLGPGTWSWWDGPSVDHTDQRRPDSDDCVNVLLDGMVGWRQREGDFLTADCWWVAQTAVNFDLSRFDEIPNERIDSASLSFKEEQFAWTDGGGGFQDRGGCVEVLGLATSDWAAQPPAGTLFPNEEVQRKPPQARDWDVTAIVDQWVRNQRPRLGFVLRGGNEGPQGHDDASCLSLISEVQLTITYTVPD